jgi:poly(A) polymerase
LAEILPEATNFELFERLVALERSQFLAADAVLRLGALISTEAEESEAMSQRLRLSNKDSKRLKALRSDTTKVVSYMSIRELRRVAYRTGKDCLLDRIRLSWAADKKETNGVQWRALLAMCQSWHRPVLPLSGEEVQMAGVPEGPEVGRVLREVEEWWIESDFTEDRFSIAERLKAIVQATIF